MDLYECRKEIDEINDEILSLFLKRMEITTSVAEYKRANNMPIMQQSREDEILENMGQKAGEEFSDYAKILFSIIMNLSRLHQVSTNGADPSMIRDAITLAKSITPSDFPKSATVACQGVKGAYSQLACDKIFPDAKISYFNSFSDVFSAIDNGTCEYGILPIENCLYGSVNQVYDLMKYHKFYITKSVKLKINHTLLAKPGTKLEDITDVFSHEQAIGQCSEFLSAHPDITVHICENTAMAAKKVATSDNPHYASISSPECAEFYGLEYLCNSIANSDNNYTRFICISKNLEIYPESNKMSLVLNTAHKPGALFGLISRFAALGLNITKLESRPLIGKDFEYMFYFDVEASVFDSKVLSLISELCSDNSGSSFLGSYSEIQER